MPCCQLLLYGRFDFHLLLKAIEHVAANGAMFASGRRAYLLCLFQRAANEQRSSIWIHGGANDINGYQRYQILLFKPRLGYIFVQSRALASKRHFMSQDVKTSNWRDIAARIASEADPGTNC
jgi:hypothetical protein